MRIVISRQPLIAVLFVSVVMMTILGFLGQLAIQDPVYESIRHLFEIKYRQNITTWYTTILYLIPSLLLALIIWDRQQRQYPHLRYWFGLLVVVLFFSVDSVSEIYGLIVVSQYHRESAGILYGWIIPTWSLVLLLSVMYISFIRALPAEMRRIFVVGMVLTLVGGISVSHINRLSLSPSYNFLSTAELLQHITAAELRTYMTSLTIMQFVQWIGAVLLINALLRYVMHHTHVQIDFKAAGSEA